MAERLEARHDVGWEAAWPATVGALVKGSEAQACSWPLTLVSRPGVSLRGFA